MNNQKSLISVVIATKNRPKQVVTCIQSICKNTYTNFEIIVVDQSDNLETKRLIAQLSDQKIKYVNQKTVGISKARNFGIRLSAGEIISFTDDDCIPDVLWLKNVYSSFVTHKNVSGVFGKTMPHSKTAKNQICPCTFQSKKMRIIDRPKKHSENFGFGNNMSFKKDVFEKIGFFEHFLGVGSVGLSAEDAEFSLRILTNNRRLMYNPRVLVYHNRLVELKEFTKINLAYSCGEIACYGYYALLGIVLGKTIVRKNFDITFQKIITGLMQLLNMKKRGFQTLYQGVIELTFRSWGVLVAFIIFLKRRGTLLKP